MVDLDIDDVTGFPKLNFPTNRDTKLLFFSTDQAVKDSELKIVESRPCYHVVRRFVGSKEFESPFALKLLSNTLNELLENPRNTGTNLPAEPKQVFEVPAEPAREVPVPSETPVKNDTKSKPEGDQDAMDVSGSSIESSTTVPYDFEANAEVLNQTGMSKTDGEQTKTNTNGTSDSKINKENFFSSDSDSSSVSGREKKGGVVTKKRVRGKRKNLKDSERELEGSDKENKELEKLLRMTEYSPGKGKPEDERSEDEKTKNEKKPAPPNPEVSLLDCLNGDEVSGNEAPDEPEGEKEGDFLEQVNEEVKNSFLMSTGESSAAESEPPQEGVVLPEKKAVKRVGRKRSVKSYRISGSETESSDSDLSVIMETPSSASSSATSTPKKRTKIQKSIVEESSDSSSDIQQVFCKTQSSPIKGRKNINKILKKESLQLETKQALKAETERKRRLAERQKMYDRLFPNASTDSKLVLDFDSVSKKAVVVVDENLSKKLKPHQKEGVQFMWNNCFESVERVEVDSGSGCILAHCMGLGKTLQVITLVHTVLSHNTGVRTVLVLCPLNTIKNWIREFKFWLKDCRKKIFPYNLVPCKSKSDRIARVRSYTQNGGVMVLSYQMLRAVIQRKGQTMNSAFSTGFLDPGPDLVICDEGHVLKNESSKLSNCLSQIKTLRRIVLTGTPLQNNLIEYYCMVHFVKPNILGTKKEFMNRFVNPINNGQFEDSTELDVRIMKRRAHVLHTMLDGFIQRFSYSVLTPFLPEKQEYVISISLTEKQTNAYRFFIETCKSKDLLNRSGKEARRLFRDFSWVRKVWTHPLVMLNHSNKLNDDKTGKPTDKPERKQESWGHFFSKDDYEDLQSSGKLLILFQILEKCKQLGDKVLVFSQSLDSLNLIEHFLKKEQEKCESRSEPYGWVLGVDYFRMDGSTSSEDRDTYCKKFNNPANKRSRLFLISTRAGGLGINLVSANRVVVFDASWNPSHDVQCIFRVYRFGQKKPCYIYRLLAAFTMEEKIYKRQVTKLSLAYRILDEHQIERHYSMGNLSELYMFDPVPKNEWKVPKVPKDGLFADILGQNRDFIVGYHEHDSLLENKEEEELTEEERRVAWEEYEKEKLSQPGNLNGVPRPYMEKLNVDGLRMVHRYKQGLAPVVANIPFVMNDNQNQVCKIVDVRTLKGPQAQINKEELLRVSRQLGMMPYEGESNERFLSRISQNVQKYSQWEP